MFSRCSEKYEKTAASTCFWGVLFLLIQPVVYINQQNSSWVVIQSAKRCGGGGGGGIECSPKVNSFHSWLDVVRYCGQVSEGTVYFSWDVTSTRRGATLACLQQSCREQQGFQQPRLQVRGSAGTHTHCARGWSPAAKAREATLCPQTLMKTTYRKRAREHACQSIKTFNLIYSTLYL